MASLSVRHALFLDMIVLPFLLPPSMMAVLTTLIGSIVRSTVTKIMSENDNDKIDDNDDI